MNKQRRPSFEKRRWFIGLTAVIGVVGGLVAILNGIAPYFEAKPPARVSQNTEIILDRSEGMAQRFPDGTTKLELARKALDLVLRNEIVGDNLALRAFGGSCVEGGTHPPPLLPFSQENVGRVREKTDGLKANGQATLVATIHDAIADFEDSKRFGKLYKRIIVITGSLDACGGDISKLVERLKLLPKDEKGNPQDPIVLDLNFIGIGMDPAAKANLDDLAEGTGGAAHFADNPEQLKNVVELIELARVKRAANAVSGILQASAVLLSPVIANLRDKDYAAAERGLREARDEFARSELPFQDLVKRQSSEQLSARLTAQYGRIYQAANKSREIQSQIISLTETLLVQAKASDALAQKSSIDKYEELRSAYNQSDDELQALLVQLDTMARLPN